MDMVRPESWTRPAGTSPVWVIAGEPGSRPRFVVERRWAERGVESVFGGSKRAGRSAIRCESCSLVTFTTGEPSRSCHGEGPCPTYLPGKRSGGVMREIARESTTARVGCARIGVWPVYRFDSD